MSPEEPGSLVAIDVQFHNGQLQGEGERLYPKEKYLTVTWYSQEKPENYIPISGGVAYVYSPSLLSKVEIRQAAPTKVGSRYFWRDTAKAEGLMFVLILPPDCTIVDPTPIPIEAKSFQDRIALFWLLWPAKETLSESIEIGLEIRRIEQSLTAEIERINRLIRNTRHRDEAFAYDVALSFAGEDRDYVERVAAILKDEGIRVFYDKYARARLWGKNLYVHLTNVYQHEAKYTVMFISEHYAKKLWTNQERESAQARAFIEHREYILPARFDDTIIPGMLPTTGYISLKETSPRELADLVLEKLISTEV